MTELTGRMFRGVMECTPCPNVTDLSVLVPPIHSPTRMGVAGRSGSWVKYVCVGVHVAGVECVRTWLLRGEGP